jgi:hypothetical protein
MYGDVVEDVDKLHMRDINWWMMWQLMMWIACISRELH